MSSYEHLTLFGVIFGGGGAGNLFMPSSGPTFVISAYFFFFFNWLSRNECTCQILNVFDDFVSSYDHLTIFGVIWGGPEDPFMPSPGPNFEISTYFFIFFNWLSQNECTCQILNDFDNFMSSYEHLTLFGVILGALGTLLCPHQVQICNLNIFFYILQLVIAIRMCLRNFE